MVVEVNLTKVHCKHIWKCHREPPPVQLIHVNRNIELKKNNLSYIHCLKVAIVNIGNSFR
jgi:hypothetical protein